MKKLALSSARTRNRGFSLIEILISMVIGLVVVGAVLVSYISSGQTGKRQAAYSEMNENAQIALSIIRQDLLLAGYARGTQIQTVSGVKSFGKTFASKAIFGCATGFSAPNSVAVADPVCGTGSSPGIEITYEADTTNTVPVGTFPSDCMGNSLEFVAQTVTVGGNAITFYPTRNRYYLAVGTSGRSELHCASAAKANVGGAAIAGQPLVDNVEAMQILYGEAAAAGSRQIVRYVAAGAVTDWQNIVSVRTCLLMRSAEQVLSLEDTASGLNGYIDCASTSQTSSDGYIRRAYFLTTTLRNKMTF